MKNRVINDSVNRITQGYGNGHRGVDLGWRSDENQNKVYANCKGTVYATLDGVSNGSEYGGGWGNYVLIKHPNGMFSRYAHLQNGLKVKNGQNVDENTVLGIIGDSGRAYGRHLHFEVQTSASSNDRINPIEYLDKPIWSGSSSSSSQVNVYYKVRTQANGWLPEVRNCDDYAGYNNSSITGVAIKVDKGSIKYRVHILGGNWLGWVNGYNINDVTNGYAGNGKVIDAIQIYYNTPSNIRPFKFAKYRVNGYDWQIDTKTGNGMDGYAGNFGYSLKKLWIKIE